MSFKYVEDVAAYMRVIIDDSDTTFIDDGILSAFLNVGYEEFVQIVSDVDPNFFMVSQNYTLAGVTEFNLASPPGGLLPIMGAAVAAPQRQVAQIIRIVQLDGSGITSSVYSPVYSYEQLITPNTSYPARYMLQGTLLKFSGTVTATIRIEYIPIQNVNWAQIATGNNEYIDEMIQFHDLIALLAAKSYFIQDGTENVATLRQIGHRSQQISDFVTRGRLRGANRMVGEDDYTLGGY